MKRLLAAALLAALLTSCLILGVFAEAPLVTSAEKRPIVSEPVGVTHPVGTTTLSSSYHGGNQSRVVSVSSGTYVGILTNEEADGDWGEMSLIHISNDGVTRLIKTDKCLGSNVNGVTVTIMADNNEDIWVYCGWDDYNTQAVTNVWFYDVSEDTVTVYSETESIVYGGSYGYSVANINPDDGMIWAVFNGGNVPGWLMVKGFNMNTREWGELVAIKVPDRMLYHYGFPDGNGGIILVTQRGPSNSYTIADTGETVRNAVKRLHNMHDDSTYTWDKLYIFHIPDPTKKEFEQITITEPVYDVENGVYPNINHAACGDVLLDSKGILHVAYYESDNATPGTHFFVKSYDTKNNFNYLGGGEILYTYGRDMGGNSRFFEDTTGQVYIINSYDTENGDYIGIWAAMDESGTEYRLVWDDKVTVGGCYVANSRNNSTPSDIATMLADYDDDYAVIKIDIGAIRAMMKK